MGRETENITNSRAPRRTPARDYGWRSPDPPDDGKVASRSNSTETPMGYLLADKGQRIVRRGGADGCSDDDLLLLELTARAPGLSKDDLQNCFVAMRMEYGADALDAIRSGHVRFEERSSEGAEPAQ